METKIVKTRHSDVYSECCDTQTLRKFIDTNISGSYDDALIFWLQQVFMLIDHAETKITVHCDDELGECHTFNLLPLHRNAPCPSR